MKDRLNNPKIQTIWVKLKILFNIQIIKSYLLSARFANKKTVLKIGGIILALLLISYYYLNHRNQNAVLIKVASSEIVNLPLKINTSGTITALNNIAINPKINSQVTAVLFHDGDYVKKDQLLFLLDDKSLKEQLDQLQSDLEAGQAIVKNLDLTYQRNQELAKEDFDSTTNLDATKSSYKTAKANNDAIKEQIENIKSQIEYTKVCSPIDGHAGIINVTVGNDVAANQNQPMVTINQITPITASILLPKKYLEVIRQNINNNIRVIASTEDGIKESGKLELIDNNIDHFSNNFTVRAIFDNDNENLWPGTFVDLTIILDQPKILTIPESAIQHSRKGDFVFAIDNDNKARKQLVKVSYIQDGIAAIAAGLQNNQKVVIDGTMLLQDGSLVDY